MRLRIATLLLISLGLPAQGQEFPDPSHPIFLVNNFSAGGQVGKALMDFEPFFEAEFGTRVDIEQIEGAAGLVGYNTVYGRPADGYTILTFSTNFGPHTFTALAQTQPPWDFDGWVPLGIYADNLSLGFMVLDNSPIKTFPDMVAAAKANPGGLTVGTIGPGRIEDVQIEELKQVFGIDVNNVYYDSGGTLLTDLLTGDLDVIMAAAIPHVDNPDVRIITMLASGKPATFPYQHLNTMADWQDELGYDVKELTTLSRSQVYGLLVKAGLPQQALDRLVAGLKVVAENPDWQAQVASYRNTVYYPPEQAADLMRSMRDGIIKIMSDK